MAATELPRGLAGLQYPITQISLAVRDLDTTMAEYHRAFGWAPWQVFDHVPPIHHDTELRGERVHYALRGAEVYVGETNFELLEPLEGPNLWSEFMDRRGEGIASIAVMFHERADGDAVKREFAQQFGIGVSMKADIGEHIEYYYLDTEKRFGCLIESGSGHAIDFVRPANVYPREDAVQVPSPASGIGYPAITQLTLVVRDLEARVSAFHEAFGWGPWKVYEDVLSDTEVHGRRRALTDRFAQCLVGPMNFEIVEPGDTGGPYAEYLQRSGEGLASIGLTLSGEAELRRSEAQFRDIGVGAVARGSVEGRERWLILDAREPFKTLIGLSLRHAHASVPPTRTID